MISASPRYIILRFDPYNYNKLRGSSTSVYTERNGVKMSRNRSIGEKFFRYTAIGLTAAAVMHASYAAEFNSETMKKMGVFLSNFTETGLRNFNLSELTGTDQGIQQIVMFAYNHIRINTPAKYISEAQEYYNLNRVSEKDLNAVLQRYMDLDGFLSSRARQQDEFILPDYINTLNTWEFPDQVPDLAEYVEVTSASRQDDGTVLMEGRTYYPDLNISSGSKCEAVAKPHKYQNKDTWAIISLHCEPFQM